MTNSVRHDLAVATAMLQQRIGRATVEDIISANQLVARIRDLKHVKVTIKSISFHEGYIMVTSNASWANYDALSS